MNGERAKKYDLEERLLDYAAAIIRLVDGLRKTPAGRHVGGQLLRSGTSPLGSHGEAQSAESARDFVHKFRVGLKELRESLRWLKLIQRSELHDEPAAAVHLIDETGQLIRIFSASITTAQKRMTLKP
jgi:four helix bundle protein